MAGRSVDVSLNIKAQDQASKALDAVGKALKDLAGAQTALAGGSSGVGKFVESLSTNVDGLSTLFKKLDTTLASTGRAYETQTRQLASVNTSIADRKRRIQELIKVETDLQRIQGTYKSVSPAKQATFVGPVPPRLTQVRSQLGTENTLLAKEEAALERLISKSAEARDANQQIRTAQAQVATALNTTTNAFLEQANALDRLSAAEKRAATEALSRRQNQALEARLAAVTGTNRTGTPASLRPQRQADLEAAFAPAFAKEDTAAIKEAAAAQAELEARAKDAADAMQQVRKYARDVAESLDPVAKVSRLVADEQQRLGEAVKLGALSQSQAAEALQRYKANLDGTNAATERQSAEFRELDTYVQELRRDFDRAAYASNFLERETAKLDRALKTVNKTTGKTILDQKEYEKALESVRRKSEQLGEQSNPQLFGLNPYQTQNLMFQFNDIATQLASGTSLTQTLSQQGGQILQLFPKVGNAIVGAFSGSLIYITPVVLAIGALVIGINEAIDAANRLRVLEGVLRTTADGANYNAKEVIAAAKSMRDFGVAIEDAMKIANIAIKAGFDQTQIKSFGEAAKGLSVVLGSDIPTAAQQLAEALTGGYDALVALDKQTNIFTDSELDNIRALIESGDALGANSEAARILTERYGKLAEDAEGPWQKAINNLTSSWDRLKTSLADSTVIQGLVSGLTGVANAISDIVTGIDRLSSNPVGAYIFGAGFSVNPAAALAGAALAGTTQPRAAPAETPSAGRAGAQSELDGLLNGTLRGAVRKTDAGYVANKPGDAAFYAAEIKRANELLGVLKKQTGEKVKQSEISKKADNTVDAAIRQAQAEGKVTTEQEKQKRLAEDIKRIRLEVQQDNPLASPAKREELAQALLGKQTEKYNDQLKQVASARKAAADQAEREAKAAAKLQNTGLFQAMALLRQSEGRGGKSVAKPYYDVNAWRAGFGSDTTTDAQGVVRSVTQSARVSPADAERDLERRAAELIDVIKKRIGAERFGDFSAKQQGAIVSLYYNYGKNADRIKKDLEPILQSGTNEQIAAMVRSFANDKPRTKNGKAVNYDRRMAEAAILAQPNASVAEGAAEFIDDTADAQDKFNDALDAENAARTRNYESQKALLGLQGEALINEQRRQAILDAIADKEAEIKRTNEDRIRDNKAPIAELSDAQRREIATSAGQLFDLQIPQVQFDTLKKQLADLEAYKSTLQENLQQAAIENDSGGMRAIQDQIDGVDERLKTASQSLLDFLSTPGNADALGLYGVELDNMLAKMTQLAEKTAEWKFTIGSATVSASEFANAFTSTAVSAIDQFAQAIASGKNAFSSLWGAFRQFAADFLLQIAKMIQQQIIFNLVSGLLKSLAGAAGGALGGVGSSANGFGAIAGMQAHGGGIIGNASTYGAGTGFRSISPAMFTNAARYHSGGIAGLKPNEVPAVLMRGEEVLTRDDPRHMLNSGGGGGSVKIVNTFDESDFFSKGASTKVGEKAILNLVRSNPRAFKQAMNGG